MATAVILLVTLIFAGAQVRHAQRMRNDQTRPYVVADIEPSRARPIVDLYVRNVGATAAYDVTITTNPALESTRSARGDALEDSVLLTEGIPTMPPGREVRTILDHVPDRIEADLPLRYDITVKYRDRYRRSYTDSYVADLSVLLGLESVLRKDEHEAAKALEDIAALMGRWTHGNRGLRVFAKDYDRDAWQNGYLIRHPKWYGRLWVAAVKRLTGRNLHPRNR